MELTEEEISYPRELYHSVKLAVAIDLAAHGFKSGVGYDSLFLSIGLLLDLNYPGREACPELLAKVGWDGFSENDMGQ